MFRLPKILFLLLSLSFGLSAQVPLPGSGGGGASAFSGLSDVNAPTPADGDGVRVDASGDYVNVALFTPTTTDLLAARMSANWGAAGADACATSGGIMFDDATAVGCSSGFTFDGSEVIIDRATAGDVLTLKVGGSQRFQFDALSSIKQRIYGYSTASYVELGNDVGLNNGSTGRPIDLAANGPVNIVSGFLGWSATSGNTNPDLRLYRTASSELTLKSDATTGKADLIVQGDLTTHDTTTVTGVTTSRCEDGAGQGVTPCHQVESFAAFDGVTFSELSTHANGAYTYCTDCTKATPCASGGSGAFAKRINGAWDCD